MPQQKNNKLLSWLVTRPAMFAIIAFVTMTAATIIASMTGARLAGPIANILVIIAFAGATMWLVRKLPGANLDRRSFVSINTAQMLITSIAFIASTIIIIYNAQTLMMRLLWLETNSSPSFIAILVVLALFYLYLFGIFIANLYAKYRRIRAMGVGMWKTLATAPFGFAMLWIPGYLMDDTEKKDAKRGAAKNWYARIIDWIIERPSRAASALVLLILMSSFTLGYTALLLTLGMGVVFAVWSAITGPANMRKKISGAYTTTAIIINVVSIIAVCIYASVAKPMSSPVLPEAGQIITPQPEIPRQ